MSLEKIARKQMALWVQKNVFMYFCNAIIRACSHATHAHLHGEILDSLNSVAKI